MNQTTNFFCPTQGTVRPGSAATTSSKGTQSRTGSDSSCGLDIPACSSELTEVLSTQLGEGDRTVHVTTTSIYVG